VTEIRLIDETGAVAAGKALDIQQAGPIEAFHTRVSADSDIALVIGSSVVVFTGPASDTERDWEEEKGLKLVERVAQLERRAVLICAGASHRTLVERAINGLKIARRRLIGSAPAALASALRAIVALELQCSPEDVHVPIAGVPPAQTVVVWSEARAQGVTLARALAPNRLVKLRQRVAHLWPPGPYALASATARMAEAAATGGSTRAFACFLVLDGEWGARGLAACVPVVLGPHGVDRIVELSPSAHERVQIETAIQGG
jgi:malate dehydrogenase